jgi:hypothetical protein
MDRVTTGARPPRPHAGHTWIPTVEPSDREWEILQNCWDHDSTERPSMEDVLRRLKAGFAHDREWEIVQNCSDHNPTERPSMEDEFLGRLQAGFTQPSSHLQQRSSPEEVSSSATISDAHDPPANRDPSLAITTDDNLNETDRKPWTGCFSTLSRLLCFRSSRS